MKSKILKPEKPPQIEGLKFRSFAGETDYESMYKIINEASKFDNDDNSITVEDIKHDYAHLTNSNPETDMIFAEINGEAVAYSRVDWWQEDEPNDRVYSYFIHILPDWRDQGIEEAMMQWCESRLRVIAREHPEDSKRFFQNSSLESKKSYNRILEAQGFKPTRYFIAMSRTLENIPEAELPEGIEARPVTKELARKVWDASVEAFRDHWGYSEPKDDDYRSFQSSKYFQPELWQAAWDGDEVVSSVQNYIDHDYNKKFQRKRGWTESISTRREWRRRGIARALIVRSMHMHKARGMTEVALGVDTENPNGALKLDQSLGYEK
jgi:mycothiol synthase